MKFVRWLLISLGILLVLAGALGALALLPSVQRWALLRATADVPDLKLNVAEVSVGFSGMTLKQVEAEKSRVAIKLAKLEADFSLTAFLFAQRLEISRLNSEIEKIDPHAFIVMQSIRDTKGGMVKKKPLH